MIRRKTFDNAKVLKKWQIIVDAEAEGAILDGTVTEIIKGGVLVDLGGKNADDGVAYGFAIDFANTEAYALLATSDNSCVNVTMNLAWGENSLPFAFSAALLQQYAALQVKYPAMRAAMILTVTGLDTLESGAELTVTPVVEAAGQVSITGGEMVYTVS